MEFDKSYISYSLCTNSLSSDCFSKNNLTTYTLTSIITNIAACRLCKWSRRTARPTRSTIIYPRLKSPKATGFALDSYVWHIWHFNIWVSKDCVWNAACEQHTSLKNKLTCTVLQLTNCGKCCAIKHKSCVVRVVAFDCMNKVKLIRLLSTLCQSQS